MKITNNMYMIFNPFGVVLNAGIALPPNFLGVMNIKPFGFRYTYLYSFICVEMNKHAAEMATGHPKTKQSAFILFYFRQLKNN